MGTPFKMKGSTFYGKGNQSPLKQEKADWSKAPDVHTGKRRSWYKKHNLKQDKTTKFKTKQKTGHFQSDINKPNYGATYRNKPAKNPWDK